MNEMIPWSTLFQYRDEIHARYPEIWDLKILRKRFPLVMKTIQDHEKVLDIGASNRNLQERLKRHFPKLVYKSMDIDREQFHDFYSLEEVQESFDVVFLFEVIEHLGLEEGVQLIKKIYDLLNEGGRLILTTPNVFNPSRFWRDATHKVAYCYDELGGLLLAHGFQIKAMYRTYSDAFHRYLFRIYVMAPLHRYLGVDFAKSILMIAEKKSKGVN
ncbi:MAG TPA: class I SAM-dependent methyltransferase [Thermodesulfobacteriota bacterium]|nr:class I SAM-dependent methyltransferase [Thermodesulfobacteriota bacterium]